MEIRARGWEGFMIYRHLGTLLRCHVAWRMRLLLRHKHDNQSTRMNKHTHNASEGGLRTGQKRALAQRHARVHGRMGAWAQISTGARARGRFGQTGADMHRLSGLARGVRAVARAGTHATLATASTARVVHPAAVVAARGRGRVLGARRVVGRRGLVPACPPAATAMLRHGRENCEERKISEFSMSKIFQIQPLDAQVEWLGRSGEDCAGDGPRPPPPPCELRIGAGD